MYQKKAVEISYLISALSTYISYASKTKLIHQNHEELLVLTARALIKERHIITVREFILRKHITSSCIQTNKTVTDKQH